MQIIYVDIDKIPEAVELYGIEPSGLQFLFYIRDHRFEYENFTQLWNE